MLQEFKEFALRGNVVDMAVGIVVGAAFGTIARSLVADVLMPPIGLIVSNVDFSDLFLVLKEGAAAGPYATLAEAQAAGAVTLNFGVFINTVASFLIIALAVFFLVRAVNRLQRHEQEAPSAPSTRNCPFCRSLIHVDATRCPHCTSELTAA